ncbi:DUF6691 family protein [Oxalobacter paraformigenes]|uniref:DUF6691 family protein n=1 Tax=Oxalobacter paraformigenes TaxID=556268 RepID=UPI000305FABA|nr:DUF6691 family protein [Oxalobacter paraformigenes]
MFHLVSLISGLLFGLGLIVSGMANPQKVIAFLDLTGNWDPSLAFVMIGAIGVGLIGFTCARKKGKTWLGVPMQWPGATKIDWRLVTGSSLFGIGWGLAGVCPGPALVALSAGITPVVIFILSMLAGMGLYALMNRIAGKGS